MENLSTDVCIAGAGPAGMILGVLLAAQGIRVTVLESHPDFAREYRGEVLMPRFSQMMKQVGLFDFLEKYPHLKLKNFEFFLKDKLLVSLDLSSLSTQAPFAVWMSQTVLLNALLDKAKLYPGFEILFGVSARGVIRENEKIVGLTAEHKGEHFEIRCPITIGADGRSSVVRKTGGFEFERENYDFDVIWFTIDQPVNYENTVRAFFSSSYRCLILPKYPRHIQCGLIVGKGEFSKIREKGVDVMRQKLIECHPVLREFADGLKDFSVFSVLQARASFVRRWAQNGCLLIGDAAHTCSPAGAIGVSVAVATAIVAADVLKRAFQKRDFTQPMLDEVQRLREKDVRKIQRLQSGFTTVVFLRYPWLQGLSVLSLRMAAQAGLLRHILRKITVMEEPLPIDPKLRLSPPCLSS